MIYIDSIKVVPILTSHANGKDVKYIKLVTKGVTWGGAGAVTCPILREGEHTTHRLINGLVVKIQVLSS